MAAAAMLFTVGAAFADPGMLLIATGVLTVALPPLINAARPKRGQSKINGVRE